jgi:hypothetical protein
MTNQTLLNAWQPPKPLVYRDNVFEISWARHSTILRYGRPELWFTIGGRGGGKSAELEAIGEQFLANGGLLFDLQSSHDQEGLAWLRNPQIKAEAMPVLLLTGDRNIVSGPSAHQYSQKPIRQLELADFEKYRVIINSFSFYESSDEYYERMQDALLLLYEQRMYWNKVIYAIVREAANLLYARTKLYFDTKVAKAMLVFMLREARHHGVAFGVDSVRVKSIDLDVRAIADYITFKNQGFEGLPEEFRFLYSYYDADWVSTMDPWELIMLTKRHAAIGAGFNIMPNGNGLMKKGDSWHKTESESILRILGLEKGERSGSSLPEVKAPEEKMDPQMIARHVMFIKEYHEKKISEEAVGISLGFGSQTLIHTQIRKHDIKVGMQGFCSICKKGGGSYASEQVGRSRSAAIKLANEKMRETENVKPE